MLGKMFRNSVVKFDKFTLQQGSSAVSVRVVQGDRLAVG